MIYSESCHNLGMNHISIFNNKRGSLNKVAKQGHMRKRSISGKVVSLYGKGDPSPIRSSEKKENSYAKRFKARKPVPKNLDSEIFQTIETQFKKSKKRKLKRNSSNPFSLNFFPSTSASSVNYAENHSRKLKHSKGEKSRDCAEMGVVPRISKKNAKNRKYLNPI